MKLSGAVRNHWANELPAAAGAANPVQNIYKLRSPRLGLYPIQSKTNVKCV